MKKCSGLRMLVATIAVIVVVSLVQLAASPPPQPVTRTFKAFLKIQGIEGDSADPQHRKEIELQTFGWGGARIYGTSITDAAPGPLNMQPFSFTMLSNSSSPRLFNAWVNNQRLQQAILTLRTTTGQDYLVVKLTDVYVISYKTAANTSQDELPVDQVDISFKKIEITYRPVMSNGSLGTPITASWSFSPIL